MNNQIKRPFTLTMQNPRTKDKITRTLHAINADGAQRQARRQAPNFSVCVEVKAS